MVHTLRIRVAADLTAAAVFTGPAIPCRGARGVSAYFKSTDANVPAAFKWQVSEDGANWTDDANAATQTILTGTVAVMNNAGRRFGLAANWNGAARLLHWKYCRPVLTAHATLNHTALEAYVTIDAPEVSGIRYEDIASATV